MFKKILAIKTLNPNFLILIMVLTLMLVISSCGKKADLYLPNESQSQSQNKTS